jgi:hypothetical protein
MDRSQIVHITHAATGRERAQRQALAIGTLEHDGTMSYPRAAVDCCSVNARGSAVSRVRSEAEGRVRAASDAPHWRRAGTFIAAVGVALLPKCPACWSVYASLSSLLGVSFVLDTRLLVALTLGSLALALIALGAMARRSRRYLPFALGVVSAGLVWAGRFALNSELLTYLSLLGLILAAVAARRLGIRARSRLLELTEHAGAR